MGGYAQGNGSFSLTVVANISPGGFSLGNALVTLSNNGLTVAGKLSLLNKSFDVSGSVQTNGDFYFKGYGTVDFSIGKVTLGYYAPRFRGGATA